METKVKARPIIFSGPMVRALLAGTKTQTRRAVKPQPTAFFEGKPVKGEIMYTRTPGQPDVAWAEELKCPYGQPDDRLWVRETAAFLPKSVTYDADKWVYRADASEGEVFAVKFSSGWKPSIFMPRTACRLLLEITAVRCERLRDISESDAVAEGVKPFVPVPGDGERVTAKKMYARLWASINGPGSWGENEWVWVVEFKRVEA